MYKIYNYKLELYIETYNLKKRLSINWYNLLKRYVPVILLLCMKHEENNVMHEDFIKNLKHKYFLKNFILLFVSYFPVSYYLCCTVYKTLIFQL